MATPLDRIPVTSSAISAIGYDPESQVLHVEMPNGHVYTYDGVSPSAHAALIGAESIGRHFGTEIKGKYTGTKLTGKCSRCADVGILGETCSDCGCDVYSEGRG